MKILMTVSVNENGDLVLILPRPAGGVSGKPCGCRGQTLDLFGESEAGTGGGLPNCPNDGAIYDMKCQNGVPRWVVAASEQS